MVPPYPNLCLREHEPLKPYTTFKIGGPARLMAEINGPQDLLDSLALVRLERLPVFVLGGGSNVLISDHGFEGLVLHPVRKGIEVVREDGEFVSIRIQAAEIWDAAVAYAVERGWWGIENLSHIPGYAGAAIVQNIGAYGQQISDVLETAEVGGMTGGAARNVTASDCRFAYRTSIFNTSAKGEWFIFSITVRLLKQGRPNLGYPDVRRWFQNRGVTEPTLRQVREAIVAIRDAKFPFPREEKGGNAGSFFKNIFLSGEQYRRLEGRIHRQFGAEALLRLREACVPAADRIKIPTAFLMDICGLKNFRIGGAAVNSSQPLVLLNQGGATADDVMRLARVVRQTIYARTGLVAAIEPELVGFTASELESYLRLE